MAHPRISRLLLRSDVATLLLLGLNGFEECQKVACTETLMVPALDDLEEQRRSVLERLGEDLQQVALVVVVDEDLLALQDVDVLLHLHILCSKTSAQVVVVGVGDLVEELDASVLHACHRLNDVLSAHGNMLHAGTSIEVTELLDLTLTLAVGRLIDRHLDLLIEVSHHSRSKRAEIRVDHLVVYGPEAVEIEHLLVPLSYWLHFTVLLVADAMIDVEELRHGDQAVEDFPLRVVRVSGQENTIVVGALNECVDSVAVGLHRGEDDRAIFVLQSLWLTHACRTTTDGLCVDSRGVIDRESDVFDSVSVLGVMRGELSVVRAQWRGEHEGQLIVADNVGAELARLRLETLFQKQVWMR